MSALALILFLVLGTRAEAFHISEHEIITKTALTEFTWCFPNIAVGSRADAFAASIRNEDLNFIRKWIKYSHFYNPHKPIEQRREGSYERVNQLQLEISGLMHYRGSIDYTDLFKRLGYAAHHLQDMAVPAHVVPIMHWLHDKFEAYDIDEDDLPAIGRDRDGCEALQFEAPRRLTDALQSIAEETLGMLTGPWSRFWIESPGPWFGDYKFGEDRFGDTSLLSRESYRTFKLKMMRRAVNATLQSLTWIHFSAGPKKPHF